MKLLRFLQEHNGDFSSARLFSFLSVLACIVDWMHAVFTIGVWHPDWATITLVLGVVGAKVVQKKFGEEKPPQQPTP